MAVQIITDDNFSEFLTCGGLLVVDFWAEWCGPCRMIAPVIEELASEYEGKVVFGKVNVDQNEELSTEYGIQSVPTFLFFKAGKLADKHIGGTIKSIIENKVKALIEN